MKKYKKQDAVYLENAHRRLEERLLQADSLRPFYKEKIIRASGKII